MTATSSGYIKRRTGIFQIYSDGVTTGSAICAPCGHEKGLYIFHLSVTGESDGKYIETKGAATEDGRTVLETVDTPSSDFTSFYDEHEKDPSHRYKSVHASGNEKHKFIDKYGDTVYQSSVFTSPTP